jgi:hypothetical protein
MILYNETYNIDKTVEADWLLYMQEKHQPAVMATGLPAETRALRLLTEIDNGGTTYTFQYFFDEMERYFAFQQLHADDFQQRLQRRYGGKFVTFKTLLEEI